MALPELPLPKTQTSIAIDADSRIATMIDKGEGMGRAKLGFEGEGGGQALPAGFPVAVASLPFRRRGGPKPSYNFV